jgi:hypothetical protein
MNFLSEISGNQLSQALFAFDCLALSIFSFFLLEEALLSILQ